jgi:fengycin family lipopeptide synthetase D
MNTTISKNLLLSSKKFEKEKVYWMEKLGRESAITSFSSDFVGGKVGKTRKKCIESHFPDDAYKGLITIANGSSYGIFIILLTGLNLLLSRYSNNEDIIIGSPVFKQDETGEYINRVLALKNSIRGEMTFKDLLYQVKNTVEEANENMNYPIEKILELLNLPSNDISSNCSLFDTMAIFGNIHEESGISDQPCNMIFRFDKAGTSLECRIYYNFVLYSKGFVERLGGYLINYCREVTRNPLLKLSEIEILSPEEKEQLLITFNDTTVGYPREKTIVLLLEDQVGKTPDAAAVVFENRMLTYRESNERSNRWAQRLEQEYNVVQDRIVGLYLQRSLEMVIAVIAILKAKAVCMPVNPPCPKERLRGMCTDSGASVVLRSKELDCSGCFDDRVAVVDFQQPAKVIHCEATGTGKSVGYCRPRDPVWLIYTSGSTGRPKGVMLNHSGIVNHAYTKIRELGARQHDIFSHSLSISFVASIWQIFSPLFIGALLRIYPGDIISDPYELFKQAHNHDVTLLEVVPSLLNAYLKLLESGILPIPLTALKLLLLTGEPVLPSLVNRWVKKYNIKLINAYGQSECSDDTLHYRIPSHTETMVIPIGKPSNNTQVYVLGMGGELQPVGALGELYIGGDGLALGYLNRPELTAEKFVPNPFRQKERMFRTGDFVRWLPDGNIEFKGRIDHQVKIRGFRVELGEIESHLLKHEQIKEAVVIARNNRLDEKYLCAYIVPEMGIDIPELRESLLSKLPDYMIPAHLMLLDSIPLTPNGKIDRKALPVPEMTGCVGYIAPRNPMEEKLAEIWAGVLGRESLSAPSIGIDDNFFQLGGHSLKATILVSRIHKELKVKMPLTEVFKNPTIRAMAEFLKGAVKYRFLSIKKSEEKEYYALSSAQKRLYILQQMALDSTSYNLPAIMVLHGDFSREKVEDTFRRLIDRHENFRTSFEIEREEPVQRVHKDVDFEIEYDETMQDEVEDKVKIFTRPFSLAKAPLMRIGVLKIEPAKHILMVDMHHIITDGISITILIKDFGAFFSGQKLPVLKIQYRDYSAWENSEQHRESLKKNEEYWLKQFTGELPVLSLPTDYVRPVIQDFSGNATSFAIDGNVASALKTLAFERGATLYMILLSLYMIFLAKLSNQEDIVVGTPVAGRRHADLEGVIGMFVNTLAIRDYPLGEKQYSEFLQGVKENTLKAFENQEYQFEELVEHVAVNRDISRNPLFDTMFALQNIDRTEADIPGLKLSPYKYDNQTSKFDLALKGVEAAEKLLFTFDYSTNLFTGATIARFIAYFKKIISDVLIGSRKDIKLSEIEIITAEEKRQVLYDFNNTAREYPQNKTLQQLFEEQVNRSADNVAVIFQDRKLTYKELNRKSHQLAHLLKEKGVLPDTIIGIMVERSVEMMVGILGILKAGGAYLPIDPAYPSKRKKFVFEDSGAQVILTQKHLLRSNKEDLESFQQENILLIDESDIYPGKTSSLDIKTKPQDLAYVLYTSGTTGKPKGVMVVHENVVNLVHALKDRVYTYEQPVNMALISPYVFDASIKQVFSALLAGHRLIIVPEEARSDGEKLIKYYIEKDVLVSDGTPMHLSILLNYKLELSNTFPTRKYAIGGEALELGSIKQLLDIFKRDKFEIINVYGPTECCDVSSSYVVTKENIKRIHRIPIGKPLNNVKLYILGKNRELQGVGVPGELHIAGAGVGRGYLNNPELTAEKFCLRRPMGALFGKNYPSWPPHINFLLNSSQYPNSPIPHYPIYMTGDLARWLWDGNIEFLGRMDHQVKVRGFRIELGEIESQLRQCDGINEVVVLAKEDKKGGNYLCAYYVSYRELEIKELRNYLSLQLPDYSIPAYFVRLERMPLTSSGKLDRSVLLTPLNVNTGDQYIAPANPVEEKLVRIWAELLGIEKESIGVNGNFFHLGGHSLKAMKLAARIRKEFSVEYPLNHIFKSPTIMESADFIIKRKKSIHREIQLVEKKEYYPLSSAQKRLFFLQQLENIGTAYNMTKMLEIKGAFNKQRLQSAVNRLIERHESLRTSFELNRNEPVQRIHDSLDFKIEEILVGHNNEFSLEDKKNKKSRPWIKNFIRPFDLSAPPLLRAALVILSPGEHILLYDIHHIIGDGTSSSILADDFIRLYTAEEPQPLRIQYKDFSCWQNRLFESRKIKDQEEYWMNLYSDTGEIPRLNVPADYPRPAVLSFEGDIYDFVFAGEDAGRFQELGAAHGATLYMNLLASFNLLLYKYTGQEDIIVGTGVMGRTHADLETIVGMFVNELAIRSHPGQETTYSDFLNEVKTNCLKAYENQDLQFEELVDKLELTRDTSRNPLFDVCLVVNNFEKPKREMKDTVFVPLDWKMKTSKFDITLFARQGDNDVYFRLEYSTALFKKETIRRFTHHYLNIMKQVGKQPGILTANIEILSKSEKNQLLKDFNQTEVPFPENKTLHRLVEEQVEKCPDKIAVGFGEEAFTYRHLDENANRLVNYLVQGKQVQPDDRVGILMESSLHRIAAILGILKAGAAYLPIEFSLPEERVKNMIDDAGIGILLSQKKFIKTLNRLQWECSSFHTYLCLDSFDIYCEDETENIPLMDKKLWEYVGRNASDEITGGGWHSSYTGEPFTRKEMEEYGDNILKKLTPLLHKDMRVLEIGCASGISMYRIAPQVGFYYGTDLSDVIIERNKEQVKREGHDNISLACIQAHGIDKIREGPFDLVIINSVIQCFHGHNYLRRVISKAIDLMGDKGYLFIGDIMDQELKADLVRSLLDFKRSHKNKNYRTKTDVSAELFVTRAFFQDLARDLSQISDVEFSNKIYSLENELTQFRYDALIRIDKNREAAGKTKISGRHKYQDDLKELGKFSINNVNSLVEPGHLAYLIYTSGSTGVPKAVAVEHRGVVNMLVCRRVEYKLTPVDVSLQLFSYAFDGFITGLFTSLISGTRILLLSEEQIKDVMIINDVIAKNRVTHFIAVPALFRAILETAGKESLSSLKVVTLAGDKLLPDLVEAALDKNKNLEIVNEYGITECSVMSTIYRRQERENLISIGKPIWNTKIYILDNNNKLLPIGVPGELCIAGVGLAREYLGNPELTAEKFIPSPFVEGERLYKTGDAARWLPEGNIELAGRRDRQLKIRGFRIELGEIESQLLKHEKVVRAAVIAKENPGGDSSLYAYIVSANELKISDLEEYLSRVLPGYMIPSHFVQLEEMPLTPSGKLDRQALLKVEAKAGGQYTPPRHAVEEKMTAIWSEVLGVEKGIIGIDDDFFHLGGHSLKAVLLVSRMHKVFNIKVPLTEIFKTPTIKGLSTYIKSREKGTGAYTSIEPVEKREYYMLSPAQKRIYILQQMDEKSTTYNISSTIELVKEFDKSKLEGIFLNLIKRHESLRTSFMMLDELPVQQIHDEVEFEIEYDDMKEVEVKVEEERSPVLSSFVRPFDLSRAPMLRVGALKTGEKQWTILVDMHHIISDGVSRIVLERDFITIVEGNHLSALKIQYKDFSQWQNSMQKRENIKKQEMHWLKEFAGQIPTMNLLTDYPRPTLKSFEGSNIRFEIEREETEALKKLSLEQDATLFMTLLALFNILLGKLSSQEDIIVGTAVAGRQHKDLEKIVGMFVNTLALRNFPKGEKTFTGFLKEVKKRTLEAFENQDYQFQDLVEKVAPPRDPGCNPLFDVLMALHNTEVIAGNIFKTNNRRKELKRIPNIFDRKTAKFDMMWNVVEIENKLTFSVEYCIKLFKKKTIERFIDYFKRIIRTVIEIPTKKLSEIEIMGNTEKRRLVKKIREKKDKLFIKEAEMVQYQEKEMIADFDF